MVGIGTVTGPVSGSFFYLGKTGMVGVHTILGFTVQLNSPRSGLYKNKEADVTAVSRKVRMCVRYMHAIKMTGQTHTKGGSSIAEGHPDPEATPTHIHGSTP